MKSAQAFRTISEVAEELGVPKHVLRFWEMRFPQIKPMKRGGGRRYYRPADVELLKGIRHLLHAEGYTIKGVQKILRDQGLEEVQQSWREERDGSLAAAGSRSIQPSADQRQGRTRPAAAPPIAARPAARAGASPSERLKAMRLIIAELEASRDRLAGVLAHGMAKQPTPTARADTGKLRARGRR